MKKLLVLIGFGAGVSMGVAQAFGEDGFDLALISRHADQVNALRESLNESGVAIHSYQADAGNEQELTQALTQILAQQGTPTVLVYNVVAPRFQMPSTLTLEELVKDFRVDVGGALVATQVLAPKMQAAAQGTILFTGGGWALYPSAQASSISLGKAALRNLAFTLNEEFRESPIRVGMVSVMGTVSPNTPFDPKFIGQAFLKRYYESGSTFEPEVQFTGQQVAAGVA